MAGLPVFGKRVLQWACSEALLLAFLPGGYLLGVMPTLQFTSPP